MRARGVVRHLDAPLFKPAWHLAVTSPAEGMTMIEELMRAVPEQLAGILSHYHSHLAR